MKRVEFANEEVKEGYQSIIHHHHGVGGLIHHLVDDDSTVMISNVIDDTFGKHLVIMKNEEQYTLDIDFLKKKMYLQKPQNTYKIIYDVYPRKYFSPDGYLYENEKRSIKQKAISKFVKDLDMPKKLELIENGNNYYLTIKFRNTLINEEVFIERILHDPNNLNTVRDVFLAIIKLFNINDFDIQICDTLGSNISIKNGVIEIYIEYQEKGKNYQKIYLEDDQFFVEKKVIGEYRDDVTSMIKKLGEKNGKEKR